MGTLSEFVVVGAGVVGRAIGASMASVGHRVAFVDANAGRVQLLRDQGLLASETISLPDQDAFVLIAVPTPSSRSGYELEHLKSSLRAVGSELSKSDAHHTIVVRSTIPPYTTDRIVGPTLEDASGLPLGEGFGVVYAPEFLREASAEEDALHPWINVVASRDEQNRNRVASLLGELGGEVRVFDNPVIAEMIKLVHNAYNAAKISFWNSMWRLCRELDIDADDVADTVSASSEASINPLYGIRGGFSFGGRCLPKDLAGLLAFSEILEVDLPIVRAIQLENELVPARTNIDLILEDAQHHRVD